TRRTGTGCWLNTHSFDYRCGDTVAVAEMFMHIIKRRNRFEQQRGKYFNAGCLVKIFLVFFNATLTFITVTREKYDYRMKIFACHIIFPVIRMVHSGIAEHLCASRHSLAEWFRKCAE